MKEFIKIWIKSITELCVLLFLLFVIIGITCFINQNIEDKSIAYSLMFIWVVISGTFVLTFGITYINRENKEVDE